MAGRWGWWGRRWAGGWVGVSVGVWAVLCSGVGREWRDEMRGSERYVGMWVRERDIKRGGRRGEEEEEGRRRRREGGEEVRR